MRGKERGVLGKIRFLMRRKEKVVREDFSAKSRGWEESCVKKSSSVIFMKEMRESV